MCHTTGAPGFSAQAATAEPSPSDTAGTYSGITDNRRANNRGTALFPAATRTHAFKTCGREKAPSQIEINPHL